MSEIGEGKLPHNYTYVMPIQESGRTEASKYSAIRKLAHKLSRGACLGEGNMTYAVHPQKTPIAYFPPPLSPNIPLERVMQLATVHSEASHEVLKLMEGMGIAGAKHEANTYFPPPSPCFTLHLTPFSSQVPTYHLHPCTDHH